MFARSRRVHKAFSRYMMKKTLLRLSPCREAMLASKGLLILLNNLMYNVVLLTSILIIRISSSRRNDSRMSINFVFLMLSKIFWKCTTRYLWYHTKSEVLLLWQHVLWEYERNYATVVGILNIAIFEMTFRSIIKKITGRRLLVDPFALPGFWKAVNNPWPLLIYLCFAKMLLRDSAMRSCNSGGAYFRSSGGIWSYLESLLFWSLWMLLATSSLFIRVSRGLELLMGDSSFDSFGLLECALKWSLMML